MGGLQSFSAEGGQNLKLRHGLLESIIVTVIRDISICWFCISDSGIEAMACARNSSTFTPT